MAFPNPDTQFKPGQSGNPNGVPKGTKHLSTWIQEMLNDESFEATILDAKDGYKDYKGAPIKAIIMTARVKAVNGDDKAREWLAKYGYGQKLEVEAGTNTIQALLQAYGVTEGGDHATETDGTVQESSSSKT